MPNTVDPSIEAFEEGRHRLRLVSLDAHIGGDGRPCLRFRCPSGSSSVLAGGIAIEILTAAAEAFNTTLARGRAPVPDRVDERRRRNRAQANAGDRARALIDEAALS